MAQELKTFQLRIKAPDETHFKGAAKSVFLETASGQTEIFSGHAPLMGSIGFSRVIVRENDHELDFIVRQGVLVVDPDENLVSILAYSVERFAELDTKSIKSYMDFILEKLKRREDLNKYQLRFLQEQKVGLEKMVQVTKK